MRRRRKYTRQDKTRQDEKHETRNKTRPENEKQNEDEDYDKSRHGHLNTQYGMIRLFCWWCGVCNGGHALFSFSVVFFGGGGGVVELWSGVEGSPARSAHVHTQCANSTQHHAGVVLQN